MSTKTAKKVKTTRKRLSAAPHSCPAFNGRTWLNSNHGQRTILTREYISKFDQLNGFKSGNTYNFGGGVTV